MTNDTSYQVFTVNPDPRVSYIENISGSVSNYLLLTKAVSLKTSVSEATIFTLSEDGGDMLCDLVDNTSGLLIVSTRARDVLESEGVTGEGVEYLPFALKDKRGRLTKGRFYIANLLRKVECMDRERSEFSSSSVDGRVLSVQNLVVQKEKVPPEAKLFRLGEWPRVIVIRSDLVQRIQDAKLTGLSVCAQGEDFTW